MRPSSNGNPRPSVGSAFRQTYSARRVQRGPAKAGPHVHKTIDERWTLDEFHRQREHAIDVVQSEDGGDVRAAIIVGRVR
jgi:hypothetical protein